MNSKRDLHEANEFAESAIPHLWKKTMSQLGYIIDEIHAYTNVHENRESNNNMFNNAMKKILSEIAKTNDEFNLSLSTKEKRLRYYKRVKKTMRSEFDKIWDSIENMDSSETDSDDDTKRRKKTTTNV